MIGTSVSLRERPAENKYSGRELETTIGLHNQSVVTSGNYRKYYEKDGVRYSHTINPATGYPVRHNLLSATVISNASAADADAVATWCMVLGLDGARKLILDDSSLEGCLTYEAADGSMQQWFSPGFSLREQ